MRGRSVDIPVDNPKNALSRAVGTKNDPCKADVQCADGFTQPLGIPTARKRIVNACRPAFRFEGVQDGNQIGGHHGSAYSANNLALEVEFASVMIPMRSRH